jgi:hypothetical protein
MSWSTPAAINDPPNRSAGGDICIGPGGEVYVCWAGVTNVSPFKEIHVGFASSTTGGTSWEVNENAFEVNGITGLLPEKGNIRVNGLPGIAVDTNQGDRYGWIYIVSGQKDLAPAGIQPDIILNRSEDGGISWSEAIKVNQDAGENIQYFPGIHVDPYGGLNILFYDDRNTSIDSAGVFLSRSMDGGNNWKEYEVSDHHFKPIPIGGLGQGYQGDNIDLTSTNERLLPVWMDNSTGVYQIWTVPLDFTSLDRTYETDVREKWISLEQNRPNPFRNSTIITYRLEKPLKIHLNIYNQYGELISRPVDAQQQKGTYSVELKSTGLFQSPGIYYYSLIAKDKQITRKMLVLP